MTETIFRTTDGQVLGAWRTHQAVHTHFRARLDAWLTKRGVGTRALIRPPHAHCDAQVLGVRWPPAREAPHGWRVARAGWGGPTLLVPNRRTPYGKQLASELFAMVPPPELPVLPGMAEGHLAPGGGFLHPRFELLESLYAVWPCWVPSTVAEPPWSQVSAAAHAHAQAQSHESSRKAAPAA